MGEDLLSITLSSIGAMLDKAGLMLGNTASSGTSATFLYGAYTIALTLNSAIPPLLIQLGHALLLAIQHACSAMQERSGGFSPFFPC